MQPMLMLVRTWIKSSNRLHSKDIPQGDIKMAINHLSNKLYIYSTVDENHYRYLACMENYGEGDCESRRMT